VLLLRLLLLLSPNTHFWLEAAADLEPPYKKKFQSPRARNTGPRGLFVFGAAFPRQIARGKANGTAKGKREQ
jgi:hypothetical protein